MTSATEGSVVVVGGDTEDDDSVIVVVELVPVAGRRAELVECTRRNSERVVNSRVGCRSYTIDDPGPPGPVVVLTKWDSSEALSLHLQTTMAAQNVQSYVGLLAAPMVPQVLPARSLPASPDGG